MNAEDADKKTAKEQKALFEHGVARVTPDKAFSSSAFSAFICGLSLPQRVWQYKGYA
ncbi:MAG: hypothetical protein WCO77_03325 [bacterium]